MKARTTAVLAAALCACAAQAQAIYRCGNSYGQEPCASAAPSPIALPPAPDAAAAAASRRETEREWKLAREMEASRLKEEARPASAYIPKEPPIGKPEPKKPEVFTIKLPADPKKAAKKKTAAKPKAEPKPKKA